MYTIKPDKRKDPVDIIITKQYIYITKNNVSAIWYVINENKLNKQY